MKAVILAIGDEVLCGDVINTNAAYLSAVLDTAGVEVIYHKTVGDDEEAMRESFLDAFNAADLIVASGGLGPTKDDMTKTVLAASLGIPMVYDESINEHIGQIMGRANMPITPNNQTQCYIPQGSVPLDNPLGTAPGVFLEHKGKTVVMLPGPPRELTAMFENFALPKIQSKAKKSFAEKYYMTSGIGESMLEQSLRDALPKETPGYRINTYISTSGVRIKAVANGVSLEESAAILDRYEPAVLNAIGPYVYAAEKLEIWEATAKLLIERHVTVASAESFTAGLFAEMLARTPGASLVLKGGIVSYSNEAKIQALGVREATIAKYGAVSAETAAEMARRASELFGADIGISFTGVAGPGPSEGKEAGTCFIGLSYAGEVSAYEQTIHGDRDRVRTRGAAAGFARIYKALTSNQGVKP